MRSSHKNRNRSRHRSGGGSGGGGGGGNPLNRVYESNGPDVKVRGNAQTIADKYLQLGRDAQSSGDIVMAESYYQHAEHYLRIIAAAQAYNAQQQQQYRRPDDDFDDEELEDVPEIQAGEGRNAPPSGAGEPDGLGDQPAVQGEGDRPQQPQQQYRQQRDQNGQSYQSRDRDRNRSRWQDRRDQQRDGGDQRGQGNQARNNEDQPRMAAPAEPRNGGGGAEGEGKWEAPSFLRRPAANAPEAAPPAPTVTEVKEAEAEAAAPPPPKRKPRMSKAAKAAAEAESSEMPPVTE